MSEKNLTPLMKQYWDIKSQHSDKILFFRMGDFYELFFEDAVIAAPLMGVTLTSRNKKSADETPMCGVPHHSAAQHINKLVALGFKVAICDQIEEAHLAKGLVRRAVTRIVSPGMVLDPTQMEGAQHRYLAAVSDARLVFVETSLGEAIEYVTGSAVEVEKLLFLFQPRELVLSASQKESDFQFPWTISFTVRTEEDPRDRLRNYVSESLGEEFLKGLPPFEAREIAAHLIVSNQTYRHLEIFENYSGQTEGSLFGVVNATKTFSGARLLKKWLRFPLVQKRLIEERLDQIQTWTTRLSEVQMIRTALGKMGDIERRLSKILSSGASPRDLEELKKSFLIGLAVLDSEEVAGVFGSIASLAQELDRALIEDCPVSSKQGGFVRLGYRVDLDEWIQLNDNVDGLLLKMETQEKENTGIASLKVRYNSVFGYYIEISNSNLAKVPGTYQRKQTLVNGERFVTPELIELEGRILSARVKRSEVEFEIFSALRSSILQNVSLIHRFASRLAELDLVTSMAWLSVEARLVRPRFQAEGFQILGSRHLVVEKLSQKAFTPNDIHLSKSGTLLLTGPNMAGKSTLMRQVALTSLMAQCGLFVPAREANLPLLTRLYTRIGASDSLWSGQSTFMVEMIETAELLKDADQKSLVILDEVGRGTSTFDGMALAEAILEFILTRSKSMCLFATHYHELAKMSEKFPAKLKNAHMAIQDTGGDIRFLHVLKDGPASRSYGIEVAKTAGLPAEVLTRARVLLEERERSAPLQPTLFDFHASNEDSVTTEVSASVKDSDFEQNQRTQQILDSLMKISVDELSPLQVSRAVQELQQRL